MDKKINIMMSGLPGKMATLVAEKIIKQKDMHLDSYALTGPGIIKERFNGNPSYFLTENFPVILSEPENHERAIKLCKEDEQDESIDMIVDYSQPDVANRNAELYCKHQIPFVMGTTGGDRKKLEEVVKNSEISAVIAPNMAKQIVGFQAMMQYASENFPNLFKDYELKIFESHQQGKKDTSGTAKAMVSYFNKLGIPFSVEQIKMIRDPDVQRTMGVPEEYLSGHGWHLYGFRSKDDTVFFQFTHNVNGRDIYADGTLDAIRFLNKKFYQERQKGKVYSMIDVLKEK